LAAKHTYVDGLSDIDSLVILDNTALEGKSPQKALARIDKVIAKRLGNQAKVEHGRMAVTVTYPDGMEIQLLPALKGAAGRVRVPSSRVDGWSEIDPVKFQAALTRHNKQFGGKLVPVIKLAKAINGQLPKAQNSAAITWRAWALRLFETIRERKPVPRCCPFFRARSRIGPGAYSGQYWSISSRRWLPWRCQ
jgi:hypothetical protein